MKRRNLLTILIAIVLGLSLCFTACGDKNGNPTGKGGPTQQQWADAGISGTFNAEVKGTLALSNVSESGAISMKWTGSDEASLDNTITWLIGQGYNSYGGTNAQKTTEEGGKIISYTAEKTVNGTTTASANSTSNGDYSILPLSFTQMSSSNESKTMVAETFYITEDFSIMGISFKKDELYLDIYEAQGTAVSPNSATWPASEIESVVDAGVPAYSGSATEYTFTSSSMGYMKTAQVMAVNGSYTEISAYQSVLAQNGFVASDDGYAKTLSNGNVLSITVAESQNYSLSTGQTVNGILITITLEKNSGSFTSWSALDLSVFSEAGIPAYSGGTSFDIDDATADGVVDTADYEQIIRALETAEQMGVLNAEDKADLDDAREKLALAQQVKAKLVIVYGTNENQTEAYKTALTNAGFASGIKKTTDYQYEVDVNEDEGKAVITITKLPIELAEDEGNGSSSGGSSVATEELDWSDLPNNVKFTLNDGAGNNYVITKIANDFLIEYSGTYTCLKASGSEWNEYVYNNGSWVQGDSCTRLNNNTVMNTISNVLFDNDISGFTKGENETVAGVSCEVYVYTDNSLASAGITSTETKKINADGFVFYKSESYIMNNEPYMTTTYQLSMWDTSVTAFEVTLPQ